MNDEQSALAISKKAYLSSILTLLVLIVVAGLLTFFIPSGTYERVTMEGQEVIVADSFQFTGQAGYPVWRWFTAPIEVLWSEDALIVIVIILFLLIIGGAFAIIKSCHAFQFIISQIVKYFSKRRYILLGATVFVFMCLGSFIGVFEEIVPLVPIIIALSYSMGWDSLTGLGMSVLAAGFGFAAGVANPFTVGVAQKLADLPLFSGILYRFIIFIIIYSILTAFLVYYVKRIEKNPKKSLVYNQDKDYKDQFTDKKDMGELNANNKYVGIIFIAFLVLIVAFIISTFFIPAISSYSLPVICLMFLILGLTIGLVSRIKLIDILKTFLQGVMGILPGVILILMANSIKLIIVNGGIMDTLLHYASNIISTTSPIIALLLIYVFVLFMNFFIPSGSAKAFLIMPIIVPLVDLIGIERQIAILAFTFGDGFSNLLYPTNAVLLISLGLTVVSYSKWLRWIIKLQVVTLILTSLLLVLAYYFNYGG